jgi:MOB kinase activator 1
MSAALPHHHHNASKMKTLKPIKNYDKSGNGEQLRAIANASLSSGNMRAAVQLPDGENLHEWLALNSEKFLSFFEIFLKALNFSG